MKFDVPKLADYSGAIQANQSMANAFSNLGNQSQDYLKMEEQKKNNEWNRAFDVQKFDLETNKYNSGLQEKADAKSANVGTLKALYPTEYGNLSNTMGNNPNLLGNVDIGNVQSYNTNIAKAAKEKEDALYQAGRDKISDGFERDRIAISRASANKPSEFDRLMGVLAPNINLGGRPTTPTTSQGNNQQNNNLNSNTINNEKTQEQPQPIGVGLSNQKYTIADYLTKGAERELVDDKGNKYTYNPITNTKILTEMPKAKTIAEDETAYKAVNGSRQAIEAIDKAIANYSNSFVGPIDGNLDFDTLNSAKHDRFNEGLNALKVENTNSLKGALSDKDMALLNRLMPNVKTETDFKKQLETLRENLYQNHNRAILEYGKKYNIGDELKYKNLSESSNTNKDAKKQSWKDYDNE